MSIASEYIPFIGGLDEASALATPKRGRLLAAENVELVFGEDGVSTARGYERLDGRAAPSKAVYYRLVYQGSAAGAAVNATITTPTGSARCLRYDAAASTLIVTELVGSITPTQTWSLAGVPMGTVAYMELGDGSDPNWAADIKLARTYYRNLIQAVPGEGVVRGVAIFKGDVYALRNAVGGATAALWKSSAVGWSLVRGGLRPGGWLRARAGNFTGNSSLLALFGCDAKNRYWKWDGATFTFGPGVYGTDTSSATNVTPALGAKAFAVADANKAFAVGQQVIVYSASNAANYMVGNVTAWATPNLTINVTAFAGVAATDWHVCLVDGTDRPFDLIVHRNHLMLAYPLGQLQTSSLGDPLTFGVNSALLGVSDEIRSLGTLRGEVLVVAQATKISLLYGSSKNDWDMRLHSAASGARQGSLQEVGGNGLFVSDAGIQSLDGSQSFGDFDGANLSRDAQRTLRYIMRDYRCCSLVKSASQYRVYGFDKRVLVMTAIAEGGRFEVNAVGFTPLRYAHQPTCAAHDQVSGDDFVVFGTEDGYVMRERSGTNFDGATIPAYLRTSYWHHKQPNRKKRWRKGTLDAIGTELTALSLRQDFDLGGDSYDPGQVFTGEVRPSGGRFGEDDWGAFNWSEADASRVEVYLDGVGVNQSLTLWTEADAEPIRLVGIELIYSLLGIQR